MRGQTDVRFRKEQMPLLRLRGVEEHGAPSVALRGGQRVDDRLGGVRQHFLHGGAGAGAGRCPR